MLLGPSLAKSSSKDLLEGLKFVLAQRISGIFCGKDLLSEDVVYLRERMGTRAQTHGFVWFWLCNNRRKKKKPEIYFLRA